MLGGGNILGSAVLELAVDSSRLDSGLRDAERQTEKATKSMGRGMADAGKAMTVGLTLPLAGVAAGLFKIGTDFEAATNVIIKGTGASGKALDGLQKDFQAVLGAVPQGMGPVATTITELNTRLDITGQTLQDVSKHTLDYLRINNLTEDSVAGLGQLFNALEADVSEIPLIMDKLTLAGQASGISVDRLAQLIIDAGPAFENLGFDLDRSIALFASFEKAGARPEEVISSLGLALNKLAKEGFTDAEAAFNEYLRRIEEAPDILSAVTIANELFGARVGGKVAEDIRAGRFEVEEWTAMLATAEGTVADTAAATLTFGDQLSIFKNQALIALEPAATALLDMATVMLMRVGPALTTLIEKVTAINPAFLRLTFIIGGIIAAIGPALLVIGYLSMAFTFLLSPIGLVVAAIAGLIAILVTDFLGIRSAITGMFQWLEDKFGSIGDAITTFKQALSGEWVDDDAIMPLHRFVGNVGLLIDGLIGRVRSGFTIMRDSFITFFQALSGDWVDDPDIQPIHRMIGNLGLMMRDIFDTLAGPLGAVWDGITDVFDMISFFVRTGDLGAVRDGFLDWTGIDLMPLVTFMNELFEAVGKVITAFREDGFIAGLKEIISVMPDVLSALWDLATAIGEGIWNVIKDVEWLEIGKDILGGIASAIVTAASFVADVATTVYNWIAGPVSRIEWGELASTIWSGIKTALTATVLTVAAIGAVIYDWIERAVAWVEWGEIASAIWSGITTAFGLFIAGIVIAAETIYDWVSRAVDWVPWGDIASAIWSGITTAFEFAVSTAASVGSTILGWLSAGVDAITDVDWGSVASTIWSGIRTAFIAAAGVVVSVGSVILGWIKSGVDAITDVEWGEIVSAIWSGITTGVTVAALGVAALATRLYDWISGGVAKVEWGDIGGNLKAHLRSAWDLATAGLEAFDTWLTDTLGEVKWDELGQDLKDGLESVWDFVDSATDEFDTWLRKTIGAPEDGAVFSEDLKENLKKWTGDAWDLVDAATENFDAWLRRTIGSDESGPAFSGDLKDNLIEWTKTAWGEVDAATEQFDTWLRKSIGAPSSGPIFTEEMFNNLLDWIDGVDWERLGERFGEWLTRIIPKAIRAITGAGKAFGQFVIDMVRGGTEDEEKEIGDGFAAALGEGIAYGLVGTGKLLLTVQRAFGAFLRGLTGAIWDDVKEWGEDTVTAWLEGFKDEVGRLDQKSDELRQAVLGWFIDLKDSVVETVDDMIQAVIGFFVDLYNRLVGNSIVPDLVNEIVKLITGMWDDIIDYLDDKRQAMIDVLKAPFEWLRDTFGWDSVKSTATDIWDDIRTHIEDGAESMKEALAAPFRWFRNTVGGIMAAAGTLALKPLESVISGFNTMGSAVVAGLRWIGEQLEIGALSGLEWKDRGTGFTSRIADPSTGAMGGGRPDEHGETHVAGFAIPASTAADPEAMQAIQMGIDGPMDDMGRGGIRDFVSNTIGDVAEWVGSVPSSVIDFVKRGASWIFDQILERFPFDWDLPGVMGGLGVRVVELIRTGLMDAIRDSIRGIEEEIAAQEAAAAQVIDGVYSGGLEGWVRATTGTVTQLFAQNLVPGFYGPAGHTGVDIANAIGTPIRAANSGLVVQSGWNGGYGNAVTIRHNGLSTLYGHMSSLNVSAGQTVTAGQLIGLMGSTGMSTGPHLHLEVRQNGVPINPAGIVPFAGGGIVTEPTIALIGEAGPEAVIPLGMNWDPSKTQIMSGNKVNIGVKPMSGGGLLEAIFGGSGGLREAIFGGKGGLLEAIFGGKGGLSEAIFGGGGSGGLVETIFGSGGSGGLQSVISGVAAKFMGHISEEIAIRIPELERDLGPEMMAIGEALVANMAAGLDRSDALAAAATSTGQTVVADLQHALADGERALDDLVDYLTLDTLPSLMAARQKIDDEMADAIRRGADDETIEAFEKQRDDIIALTDAWVDRHGMSVSEAIDYMIEAAENEENRTRWTAAWESMLGQTGAIISGSLIPNLEAQLADLNNQMEVALAMGLPLSIKEGIHAAMVAVENDLIRADLIEQAALEAGLINPDAWRQTADYAAGIFSGQLHEQLEQQINDLADVIEFGVANEWAPAVLDGLMSQQDELTGQIQQVSADMGIAFADGLLDPVVARRMRWATIDLLDEGVLEQVHNLIDVMPDEARNLVDRFIEGMKAGEWALDQAAEMLPNTVIPHLEQLEQKLVVDLAEAFLLGTDPAGIEANLAIITELLDALGATAESTAASMAIVPDGTMGWSGQPSMGAQGSPSPVDLAFMEMQTANLLAHTAGTSVASQMGTTPIQKLIEQQIDAINTMHMWAFGKPADIQMADGGVITEPIAGLGLRTGTRYLMGERGDEAVVPLDGNNGRRVVNNNITLQLDRRTVAEAANQQTFEDSRLTVNLLGGA